MISCFAFILLITFCDCIIYANEIPNQSQAKPERQVSKPSDVPRTLKKNDRSHVQIFPSGDLYPRYIADPRRPQNGVMIIGLDNSEIKDGGDWRWHLTLGGRFGLLKFFQPKAPDYGFEVSLEAGFLGQFNIPKSWDNNGWDGFYGLMVAYRPNINWAFKIASQHDSSHIGDEYIESTGAKLIHYSREELAVGISWRITPRLQIYTEFGNNFNKSEHLEAFRIQG